MKEVQLRGWQREAFALYQQEYIQGKRVSLWEATPGAGKTTAALQVIRDQLARKFARRALVVVPTSHLRYQWARAAAQVGIQLDFTFGNGRTDVTADYHGAVVTYQQIAQNPGGFRSLAGSAVVVLDEVHHAGDGLAWGSALRSSIEGAPYILCLSGTAFRSDTNPIPYVRYDGEGMSLPDFTYSYERAVQDRVCRPTAVFTYGGEVSWQENEQVCTVSFSDQLDPSYSARRLRAALDPESGWIQPMLKDAHRMLLTTRAHHQKAGGLIVCADQDHARALAACIEAIAGQPPTVVLSDDSGASKRIKQFNDDSSLWLVACNMVSEGVDIPRLRVGVYATATRTKLYFRQFLGRIVRRQSHVPGLQVSYLYVPADPTLHRLAEEIETECRHSLKAPPQEGLFADDERRERRSAEKAERSWVTLGANNSGIDAVLVHGNQLALFGTDQGSDQVRDVVDREVELHIEERSTRTESKQEIAAAIRRTVGILHRRLGKHHSEIHTSLNKAQRVRSQLHCTEAQLKERLSIAQQMLERG